MKQFLILLCITLFSSIQPSQAQCLSGNCQNGKGVYKQKDRSTYQGQFVGGQFHGRGTLKFAKGDVYIGDFLRGKKHGTGRYIFADKSEFIGEFINDERSGKGKMNLANGDIYKGEWRKGLYHGVGQYIFANGDVYDGEFVNGELHGNGILTQADGSQTSGTWSHNVLSTYNKTSTIATSHGQPPSTKDCTRDFCNNEEGSYYYADGSVYTGYFVNGNPEGEGECNYANGDLYKGGWKNHAPHGEGIMTIASGQKIAGKFNYGQLITRTYADVSSQTKNTPVEKRQKPKFQKGSQIYAVVVGVSAYNHMKSLKYTDDDAYQLYAFLKSPKGGAIPDENIKVLIDDAATTRAIEKSMDEIFSKADEDDVILLYLSGHGLEGYFVPYDFDGQNNLLSYKTILSHFDQSSAKNKLLITDACHSGSMFAAKGKLDESLKDYYKIINENRGGTALLTSSKTDEVSLEYSGMRQGIFSHFLIRGLKGEANQNGDLLVSLGELYDFVYKNVQSYTNRAQSPSLSGNYSRDMPVAMIYEY